MSASSQVPDERSAAAVDYGRLTADQLHDKAAERGVQSQGNQAQTQARLVCSDEIIQEICRSVEEQLKNRAANEVAPPPASTPGIDRWALTRRSLYQFTYFILLSSFWVKGIPKIWTWMIRTINAEGDLDLDPLVSHLMSGRNMYNRWKWLPVLWILMVNVFKFNKARKYQTPISWWAEIGLASDAFQCFIWYLELSSHAISAIYTFHSRLLPFSLHMSMADAPANPGTPPVKPILASRDSLSSEESSSQKSDKQISGPVEPSHHAQPRPQSLTVSDVSDHDSFRYCCEYVRHQDLEHLLRTAVQQSVAAVSHSNTIGDSLTWALVPVDTPQSHAADPVETVPTRSGIKSNRLEGPGRQSERRRRFHRHIQQRNAALAQVMRSEVATLKTYHRGVLDEFRRILAHSEMADRKLIVERQALRIDLATLTEKTRRSIIDLEKATRDAKLAIVDAGKRMRRRPPLDMLDLEPHESTGGNGAFNDLNARPPMDSQRRLQWEVESLKMDMNSMRVVSEWDKVAYFDLYGKFRKSQEKLSLIHDCFREAWFDFEKVMARRQEARVVDRSQEGQTITLQFY